MTTNKAVSSVRALGKASRKDKKDKKRSVAKLRKRSIAKLRKTRRNKINSSSLSDLYTYESPVTNNAVKSNSNVNNVNVVYGLKDYLAVKK